MPTGLQICAKMLQMDLPGGRGIPSMQPKRSINFKLECIILLSFWLLVLHLNILIIVATVPIVLQTCAKVLQMHHPGGWGTPSLQPKNNQTFKLASAYPINLLASNFVFK